MHNDTDTIAVSITVGGRPPQTLTMKTGDVNNGTHNVGMAFAPVNVDLSDFVIFNYLILNSGHADQKEIDDQLTGFAKTLADKGVQAAKDAISKGATALVGAAMGSAVMPLIGTILGMIAGLRARALTGLIFVNCDGPVAAEQVALTGVQLRRETLGGGVVTHQTSHPASNPTTAAVEIRAIRRRGRTGRFTLSEGSGKWAASQRRVWIISASRPVAVARPRGRMDMRVGTSSRVVRLPEAIHMNEKSPYAEIGPKRAVEEAPPD